MTDFRAGLGVVGERVAAGFLEMHGLRVLEHNVAVDGGEIDLVALDRSARVVVEVRTITGPHDPLGAFDRAKANQVGRLANRVGADRVDLVAIRLAPDGAELRWIRGVT